MLARQTRNGFVAEAIKNSGAQRVLDIGCGNGGLLAAIPECERWGVDMDQSALAIARETNPTAQLVHQTGADLPFDDLQFDAVVLSEVIEHVGDENKQAVIDEAHRVLRPGGTFVFTAPYAGVLAWADPMDVKRRLPWLYRLYMRVSGHEPETAMSVGHKHVSSRELTRLFTDRFVITHIRHTGPVTVVLYWIQVVMVALKFPDRAIGVINRIRGEESGITCPPLVAYSVRLVAEKIG